MQYSFQEFKVVHSHVNQMEFDLFKVNTKVYLQFQPYTTEENNIYEIQITWTARSTIHAIDLSSFVFEADGFIQREYEQDEIANFKILLEKLYENFEEEYYNYISDKSIRGNKLPPNDLLTDDEVSKLLETMQQEPDK